jgi:hypothetical protein
MPSNIGGIEAESLKIIENANIMHLVQSELGVLISVFVEEVSWKTS